MNFNKLNEKFDIIILGAGPAGLFTAKEIINRNSSLKIGIVDAGKSLNDRNCKLISENECSNCNICHAVYGVGGAGMFSDGKLSNFPAGSGLANLTGNLSKVTAISNYIMNIFGDYFIKKNIPTSQTKKNYIANKKGNQLTEMKSYNVINSIDLFMMELEKLNPLFTNKDTLLHAPVWEMCWDKVITDDKCETNADGFYVIGDALGAARGIVQAAVTGVLAAESIVTKYYNKNIYFGSSFNKIQRDSRVYEANII